MSQAYAVHHFRPEQRKKQYRTLSLICEDESLSDTQIKAYQSRLQEYRTFLDSVSRLALCGNVCVTEESVTIGEHGLLTGESLNALQHAGAISVYNTLQQNNWEYPVSEEGEVAMVKTHINVQDEFLDSEKPIRSDWPAVHISECFVDGERAKLHGFVRPLRTFLPPTIVFRNAADVDEDIIENDINMTSTDSDVNVEIIHSSQKLCIRKPSKDGKEDEYIPIAEYYFSRQNGYSNYVEDKGDFRFKCAVCQRIFYSNTKLMSHILSHVDEFAQLYLDNVDSIQCSSCSQTCSTAFELRDHVDKEHSGINIDPKFALDSAKPDQVGIQTASQLLLMHNQQRAIGGDPNAAAASTTAVAIDTDASTNLMGPNLNGMSLSLSCRTCGKGASTPLALAHHLQSTHRQWEMPYVCRLCLFRSSMFEDLLDHFKKVHDNSNHLLCTYCLRIFTPADARASSSSQASNMSPTGGVSTLGLGSGVGQTQVYLQHLRMHHVKHQVKRCTSCRLNFTNKSDYQVHRRLDHKTSRGIASDRQELRTDAYESELFGDQMATNDSLTATKDDTAPTASGTVVQNAASLPQSPKKPHVTLMNAPEAACARKIVSVLPDNISSFDCLECGHSLDGAEHSQYLPCTICRFATCCSVGFRRHIQKTHCYSASPAHDLDSGMPMVRPITFDWIGTADQSGSVDAQATETPTIEKYMNDVTDPRLFYCSHCGQANLDGNGLAGHLVEECGTLTATLDPDGVLFTKGRNAQVEVQQHESDGSILFEATTDQSNTADVMMLAVDDGSQLVNLGPNQNQLVMTEGGGVGHVLAQPGGAAPGTTIDITDVGGEVVQQFILPDDLQLEEGQTLVMIQGEDGQPQLAIVNQADLIGTSDSQMMMTQSEDDGQNNLIVYANSMNASGQIPTTNVLGTEDEKENHQFIV